MDKITFGYNITEFINMFCHKISVSTCQVPTLHLPPWLCLLQTYGELVTWWWMGSSDQNCDCSIFRFSIIPPSPQACPLSASTPAASIGSVLLDTAFQNVEILPSAPLLTQLLTILLPLSNL